MDGYYEENMARRRDRDGGADGRNYSGEMVRYTGRTSGNGWRDIGEIFGDFFEGFRDERYSRNQPRTRSGRFKRMRFSQDMESEKETIGRHIARRLDREDIKDLVIKEASSLIKKASEDKVYEVIKEYCELCMAMCAYIEDVPGDVEEQATEEAIEGYERMFSTDDRDGDYEYDQYGRRSRRRYRR